MTEQLLLPAIRADFSLAETYQYRPSLPLRVPISALAGRKDDHRSPEQVTGWALETSAAFASHWFEGNHFFLSEHRDAVIKLVVASLEGRGGAVSLVEGAPRFGRYVG